MRCAGSSPWIVAPTTRGDIEIHEVDSARLQWSERDASASVTDTTPPKFVRAHWAICRALLDSLRLQLLRDTFLRTFCRSATVNSDRSCVVSVNDRNCIAIWRRGGAPSHPVSCLCCHH